MLGYRVTSQTGHGVHKQRYAVCAAQLVCSFQRLTGADLSVGALNRRQDGAGHGQCILQGTDVNSSRPVHGHLGEQRRVLGGSGMVAAGGQDR